MHSWLLKVDVFRDIYNYVLNKTVAIHKYLVHLQLYPQTFLATALFGDKYGCIVPNQQTVKTLLLYGLYVRT